MRIALGLEYDGRSFCGWQSQPGGCAVQDALERALASICARPVRVAAPPKRIGRTRLIVPEPEHPWRRFGKASGKEFWKEIREEGRQARRASAPIAGALE